jgi:hypothetical protein
MVARLPGGLAHSRVLIWPKAKAEFFGGANMCYGKNDSLHSKIQILLISVFFILIVAASASAREVTLAWDANSEPDLDHYVVYWGVLPGNYSYNSGNIGITEFSVQIPDDGQTYFFAVTAVDQAGLESDYSNEVSTEGTSTGGNDPLIHIIPMNSNWNLISISNGTGTTSIEDALAPIMADVISVWAYYNGQWHVYDPENPNDSDLLDVEPGQGLWVNMRENTELSIPGEAPVNGIDLAGGWNLVGFSSPSSRNIADVISSIDGNVVSVWAYQNGQWKIYDPQYPDYSDLTTMEPGYGYWIKMDAADVWTY